MDIATLLLLEGILIGFLVSLRVLCLRVVDLESIPRCIVRRIEIGNRIAPWVGALALAAVAAGVVMTWGPV
ncbi:MAG: hypothetical protein L0H93_19815 [Nocardioides sp.]|nr:hypothetical protein [Nocardioides sp.]